MSFESLHGTCDERGSPSAATTLPSAESERLINLHSSSCTDTHNSLALPLALRAATLASAAYRHQPYILFDPFTPADHPRSINISVTASGARVGCEISEELTRIGRGNRIGEAGL